jgi:hypothetical protein
VKKLKKGTITLDEYRQRMRDIDPEDLQDVKFSKKMILSVTGHKKRKTN